MATGRVRAKLSCFPRSTFLQPPEIPCCGSQHLYHWKFSYERYRPASNRLSETVVKKVKMSPTKELSVMALGRCWIGRDFGMELDVSNSLVNLVTIGWTPSLLSVSPPSSSLLFLPCTIILNQNL